MATSRKKSSRRSTSTSADSTTNAALPANKCCLEANKNERPKILCLGMSYPSLENQLKFYNVDLADWLGDGRTLADITVEDIFQCVGQGMLTEMDARDLARCVATEIATNTEVYTVSQEKAAEYDETRHLHANFNRHRFVQSLHFSFGRDDKGYLQKKDDSDDKYQGRKMHPDFTVRFRQAILDYFWIPQGWDQHHWSPSLFSDILPTLVRNGLLDTDDDDDNSINQNTPCGVYLPFCFHVFRQVINALPILREYFAITFLRKKDLHEVALWKGTQTIDECRMKSLLGKRRDQEEVYCTFGSQEVTEAGEGPRDEPKKILVDILTRLEDFDDIRMIKLRPLKQHNPLKKIPVRLHEKGGLQGLIDPNKVKRGFHLESLSSDEGEPISVAAVDTSESFSKKNILFSSSLSSEVKQAPTKHIEIRNGKKYVNGRLGCPINGCDKVADSKRSNYMCKKHYRLSISQPQQHFKTAAVITPSPSSLSMIDKRRRTAILTSPRKLVSPVKRELSFNITNDADLSTNVTCSGPKRTRATTAVRALASTRPTRATAPNRSFVSLPTIYPKSSKKHTAKEVKAITPRRSESEGARGISGERIAIENATNVSGKLVCTYPRGDKRADGPKFNSRCKSHFTLSKEENEAEIEPSAGEKTTSTPYYELHANSKAGNENCVRYWKNGEKTCKVDSFVTMSDRARGDGMFRQSHTFSKQSATCQPTLGSLNPTRHIVLDDDYRQPSRDSPISVLEKLPPPVVFAGTNKTSVSASKLAFYSDQEASHSEASSDGDQMDEKLPFSEEQDRGKNDDESDGNSSESQQDQPLALRLKERVSYIIDSLSRSKRAPANATRSTDVQLLSPDSETRTPAAARTDSQRKERKAAPQPKFGRGTRTGRTDSSVVDGGILAQVGSAVKPKASKKRARDRDDSPPSKQAKASKAKQGSSFEDPSPNVDHAKGGLSLFVEKDGKI